MRNDSFVPNVISFQARQSGWVVQGTLALLQSAVGVKVGGVVGTAGSAQWDMESAQGHLQQQ